MILSVAAAAAAVIVAPSGDRAHVRANVAGLDRPAAYSAIGAAAKRACAAVENGAAAYATCVDDAVWQARRDYDRLKTRRALQVAGAQ